MGEWLSARRRFPCGGVVRVEARVISVEISLLSCDSSWRASGFPHGADASAISRVIVKFVITGYAGASATVSIVNLIG